ncbi:MAG: hypothetical protein IJC80_03150 [Clostridia bacterium]|nr:hypothetical protein [Clostridia bacterium]
MDEKNIHIDGSGASTLDDEREASYDVDLEEKINQGDSMDDTDDLVSPDRTIFTKVTKQLNKPERHFGYAATFHGTDKEKESFELDEQYASSTNADKQFKRAFGISETGSYKTISTEPNDEGDFGKDNIHSNDYEYTDIAQRAEIRDMYRYAKRGVTRRLIFCMVFTAFLFLLEIVFPFFRNTTWLPEYLNVNYHPYIHMLVSFALTVACAVCAREQLYHGIRSIFKKEFLPESCVPFVLMLSLVQLASSLVSELIMHDFDVTLFTFPAALTMLASLIYTLFNIKRERYGFDVLSVNRSKFVLERVNENTAEAEYDTFTTTSNGHFTGRIARVAKTPFVKNYFLNTNSPVTTSRFLKPYYAIALIVPFIFALVFAFITVKEQVESQALQPFMAAYGAINVFVVGAILILPVGILLIYSVPFLLANTALLDDGVSIIGEDAIDEFAEIGAIVVNDTTAFPPRNVKIKNIMGYNDYTIEKITYLAASGFSVIGGPLADVFDAVLNDAMSKSQRTKFVCSGRSYLSVSVDGQSVIFADKYGMTAQGIEVGNEREEKSDMSVMYMACNGVLCSKMYIKYELNQQFVKATKKMNSKSLSIGIRTFDPNINNDLIQRLGGFSKKEVRVIKLEAYDDIPSCTHRCDGKIVSKQTSSSLLRAITMCRRIVRTRKVLKAVGVLCSLVGAVYLGLSVFGVVSVFNSAIVSLLYALTALVMYIITVLMMPSKK